MTSASVDDYWAKLKASTAPKQVAQQARAAGAAGAAVSSSAKVATGQACSGRNAPPVLSLQQPAAGTPPKQQPACTQLKAPELWQQTAEATQQHAVRLVEGLKSNQTSERLQACAGLKALVHFLGSPADQSTGPVPTVAQRKILEDMLEGALGKMLLRRFDDSCQSVREAAVGILKAGLQAVPAAVLPLLPYTVPVLEERLAIQQDTSKVVCEGSEEVRLLLAQVVVLLVELGGRASAAYTPELVGCIQVMLSDSFHEVNLEGCKALLQLNSALGLRLAPVAKQLVADVLTLTTHKRHRVRIAALQALGATMHQGAHEMILEMIAWRDPNVVPVAAFYGDDLKVNFAGKLATDTHVLVRLEWVRVLGDWLLNLRERVDHEPRLLPYLLSALTDTSPVVAEEAAGLLDRLGAAYEADHAKDLTEAAAYLPEGAQGVGWGQALSALAQGKASSGPLAITAGPQADRSAASACEAEAVQGCVAGACQARLPPGVGDLPATLTRPWRLGALRVAQEQCGRSLHALVSELLAWQVESRVAAATLLRTMLFLASDIIHRHVQLLLPALCRAVRDPDVSPLVLQCMAISAASLPPQLVLHILLPRLEDTREDNELQAGILSLIAAGVRGASQRPDLAACLPALIDILVGDSSSSSPASSPALILTSDTRLKAAASSLLAALLMAQQAPGSGCSPQDTIRLAWAAAHLSPLDATANDRVKAVDLAAQQPEMHGEAGNMEATAGVIQALIQTHLPSLLDMCDPCASPSSPASGKVLARLIGTAASHAEESSDVGRDSWRPQVRSSLLAVLQRALPCLLRSSEAAEACLASLLCFWRTGNHACGHQGRAAERSSWAGLLGQLVRDMQDAAGLPLALDCLQQAVQQRVLLANDLLAALPAAMPSVADTAPHQSLSLLEVVAGRGRTSTHPTTRQRACTVLPTLIGAVQSAVTQQQQVWPASSQDQELDEDQGQGGDVATHTPVTATGHILCHALLDPKPAVRLAACEAASHVISLLALVCSGQQGAGDASTAAAEEGLGGKRREGQAEQAGGGGWVLVGTSAGGSECEVASRCSSSSCLEVPLPPSGLPSARAAGVCMAELLPQLNSARATEEDARVRAALDKVIETAAAAAVREQVSQ